jgi:hypothetical protein
MFINSGLKLLNVFQVIFTLSNTYSLCFLFIVKLNNKISSRHDMAGILLRLALNTSQSINHINCVLVYKSGSLRFSQFSGCWLILSVYILMSFDFPFVMLLLPLFTNCNTSQSIILIVFFKKLVCFACIRCCCGWFNCRPSTFNICIA